MYKTFYYILVIVWILDVLNLSCMHFLDTSIPVNNIEWILIWMLLPSPDSEEEK